MSDLEIMGQLEDLEKRLRRQEAKPSGPSLGEFYGQFQGLPGLRGLWYPGSLDQTGALYDQSGQGRTLTYNGNPVLALHNNLVPYMTYDGTGDYHSRANEAGLNLLGTDTTITTALRGVTVGGIFWADSMGTARMLITKDHSGGTQRSWLLHTHTDAATCRFHISANGSTLTQVNGAPFTPNAWYFSIGRFTPSTELAVFSNGVYVRNTTSIPAALFNSNQALNIAAREVGGNLALPGRCALAFVASAAWPDTLINYLWQRSRVLFNV